MSDDLARVIAFAYLRRGVDVMERSKLLHLLTFDLRWFSPDPAKRILARAIESGLLAQEGEGLLRVTFDARSVDVPLNWKPREDLADATGPIDIPARQLAALTKSAPTAAAPTTAAPDPADAERARLGGLVTAHVARLILARRAGEDVRDRATDHWARLAAEASTR